MKILVSGTLSGLGKYVNNQLGGIAWDRSISQQAKEELKNKGVDIIIHCAFNSNQKVNSNSLYDYLADNILLTKELLDIPHKKFIFISSVDVYPKTKDQHSEDEDIPLPSVTNLYALTKLMSESIVMKISPDYLILRCSALLGIHSRSNSLIKITEEQNPWVTLTKNSSMNYILHSQIVNFIKYAIGNKLSGVYNVTSSKNITIGEIADMLGKKVRFGSHSYFVGHISNKKISKVFPIFKRTSREAVLEFLKYLQRKRPPIIRSSSY